MTLLRTALLLLTLGAACQAEFYIDLYSFGNTTECSTRPSAYTIPVASCENVHIAQTRIMSVQGTCSAAHGSVVLTVCLKADCRSCFPPTKTHSFHCVPPFTGIDYSLMLDCTTVAPAAPSAQPVTPHSDGSGALPSWAIGVIVVCCIIIVGLVCFFSIMRYRASKRAGFAIDLTPVHEHGQGRSTTSYRLLDDER